MSESRKAQNGRDILNARAKALAAAGAEAENQATTQTVGFHLAGETYGLELRFVREVLPPQTPTPIPGVPAHIAGIINVRGEILSVMDLGRLFDLASNPDDTPQGRYVLVLWSTDMAFAIFADTLLGIGNIDIDQLRPAPATLSGVRARYIKGITYAGGIVLDGEKLLTDKSLIVDHTTD